MDFIRVAYKEDKTGIRQFYPSLQAVESQDLVIRGGQFAAIWDESIGLYNRRMSHLPAIIDRAFIQMVGEQLRPGDSIMKVRDFDNQIFNRLQSLIRGIGDMGPELDTKLIFADQTPTKEDAATFKLPYALIDADCPAWDEVCTVLYGPEERLKFEYAIGSILTGYSLRLHKLYVFYGAPGTGKSTIMDVIELLFQGHTAAFDAYELGSSTSSFPLEPFKNNPLVALDQDADLSKLDTNVFLNKLVAHDKISVNSKGKSLYEIVPRCCMFIGTNKAVKMTDSKSGLYRRVVDIHPTGTTFDETDYRRLTAAMRFELGAIAQHCINVFENLGPMFFTNYKPTDMMSRTNDVYNFVQDNRLILAKGITVKNAATLYKEWCDETETRNVYKQYQLRDLLKDYFEEWHEQIMIDGVRHRSWLQGLKELETFSWKALNPPTEKGWLDLTEQPSIFDQLMAEMPAQYSTGNDAHPLKQSWEKCSTTLRDLDTAQEHYVKVPTQHIVIDFDLKDADGNKSLEVCLEAASVWPPTYAESSRSGNGLHLHYSFAGEVAELDAHHSEGVEVKTLLGGASLRRRYSSSNGLPVATISSGLAVKEEKPVISATTMASEKGLRKQILRGLNKEVWPHTKPSMDFIKQVLEDAVKQDLVYDVTDMWDDILQFAMGSGNQQAACINIAMNLPLKSEVDVADIPVEAPTDKPIADFDLEVYPNLFAFAYMPDDSDVVVKMINPSPEEIMHVIENFRLVGFYNRLYDNHIAWARTLGYSNEQLYQLSQAIIVENNRHKLFGAAYGLAYADLYDILTKKQSLKKWMVDLGLPHMEMDIPWDQPVPEDRMLDVMEYLENDVRSTREVRRRNQSDWRARELLCEITGLQMSNTANQHSAAAVFGDAKDTERELKYTDLRELFPGYEFDRFKPGKDKSTYRGVVVGEGGYVYAEPGYYTNVALLDVASMHPTSIIELNLFGKYTKNYENLLNQRLEVKQKISEAKKAGDKEAVAEHTALSDALKLVINSVYGLTAASFPNKFRNPDNIDNIVAKRGALFMVALKEFVEQRGFKVVHIKTDSIKIPNATQEIIEAVGEFGSNYGYTFEHEATYDKFVLFNDAVYIARKDGEWSATGKQFQRPVVFKTLLSNSAIVPSDYVEVKQVAKGHMYLVNQDENVKQFVGKFGAFVPVVGGRQLVRIDGEKTGAVTETKGYLWELDEVAKANNLEIDISYFQALVDEGKRSIEKYVSYEDLIA